MRDATVAATSFAAAASPWQGPTNCDVISHTVPPSAPTNDPAVASAASADVACAMPVVIHRRHQPSSGCVYRPKAPPSDFVDTCICTLSLSPASGNNGSGWSGKDGATSWCYRGSRTSVLDRLFLVIHDETSCCFLSANTGSIGCSNSRYSAVGNGWRSGPSSHRVSNKGHSPVSGGLKAYNIAATECDASLEHQTTNTTASTDDAIAERQTSDGSLPIGVLSLRKASDSECFSRRSRRRVPLVFSNEVDSITFPESNNISLVSASSTDAVTRTNESVCSSAHRSSRCCISDTIIDSSCSSSVTESTTTTGVNNSRLRGTALELTNSDRSEKGSGVDKGGGIGMDSVVGCNSGRSFDVRGGSSSSRFKSVWSDDVKNDLDNKGLQKRRRRPLVNGLVYIEDDKGTRYGIGYCCPRHPLIAARVLTSDSNEKIDVDFFFRRMQTALLQRQALQEAFDWQGPLGISPIDASNSVSNIDNGTTNSGNRSDNMSVLSSNRLVIRNGRTSMPLENAGSSNELGRYTGKKPAEGMLPEAGLGIMVEEVTAEVNAEDRAAAQEITMRTSTLQTARQETESSKDYYFRLINSEGDLLPGVVIDIYDKYASIQLLACVEALQRLLQPHGIVVRLDHPDRLLEHPQQHHIQEKKHTQLQSQQELELPLLQQHLQQQQVQQQQMQQQQVEQHVRQHRECEKHIFKGQWYGNAAQEEGAQRQSHETATSFTSTKTSTSPSVYLRYSMKEHAALPPEFPRDLRVLSFGETRTMHRNTRNMSSNLTAGPA